MSSLPRVDRALVHKFFAGHCTAAEQEAVRAWLLDPAHEHAARVYMQDVWQDTPPDATEADTATLLQQTWQRINGNVHSRLRRDETGPQSTPTRRGKLVHGRLYGSASRDQRKVGGGHAIYGRVAAACVVVIMAGAALWYAETQSVSVPFYESRRHALSSTTGQIIMKVLPDSTRVWLNAQSTLRYPQTFAGTPQREVWLEGEAYFDVTEDKQHPFIVHAPEVNIRVLGTAFNVKSYMGDATVEITLVRGKVALETEGTEARQIELKPNQQAVFSRTSKDLALADVETDRYTSWMHGSLVFEDSPVEDVINALERWYGVTIHLQQEENLQCRLTARIDKESLKETLDLLSSTTGIRYTIAGDRIEITGTLCNDNP